MSAYQECHLEPFVVVVGQKDDEGVWHYASTPPMPLDAATDQLKIAQSAQMGDRNKMSCMRAAADPSIHEEFGL
jgi:hypothetical protein